MKRLSPEDAKLSSTRLTLNHRHSSAKASPTMSFAARKSALPDSINLAIGEPDASPPPEAIAAAVACLESNGARYGPALGISELRTEIAKQQSETAGVEWSTDEVAVTCGGKQALAEAFRVLLNPGDEVLVLAPYWPSFLDQIKGAGGVPVVVPALSNLRPNLAAAEQLLSKRTQAVVINDPSNPGSICWRSEEKLALAQLAREKELWLIADQVYDALRFDPDHTPLLSLAPDLKDQTVVVTSFSKSFAMTGYRVGAALAPSAVIAALGSVIGATTTHTAMPSQCAALAALRSDSSVALELVRASRAKVEVAMKDREELKTCGVSLPTPEAAFYLFPQIEAWMQKAGVSDDVQACRLISDQAGVILLPGSIFGAPGYLRISTAVAPDTFRKAWGRLVEFFRTY